MLGLAALALATAIAPEPVLESAASWWEKVTYTIGENGSPQACVYESSNAAAGAQSCDDDGEFTPTKQSASASNGSHTKITIERRFAPGRDPGPIGLASGDILLGGTVLALAFAEDGSVRDCRVLAQSGDIVPAYGCLQARAESFAGQRGSSTLAGVMTILVYGHEEVLT